MADSKAASGLMEAPSLRVSQRLGALLGNVRFIVVGSLVLISGSFAAAGVIQMRLDREHALAQAAVFEDQRAETMARDLSSAFERYDAIGRGFTNTALDAESSAALAEAGGAGLRNAAVLDSAGHLIAEMKSAPHEFLPLPAELLGKARLSRIVTLAKDGQHLVLAVPAGGRIAVLEIDPAAIVASAPDSLIALSSGRLIALGRSWSELPDVAALALGEQDAATRIIESPSGARLVSLARLSGTPVVVGASVDVGQALDAWTGTLPLYLFLIFGPALAGAGLAAVLVREFERRMRSAQAQRNLRARRPEEAKMLVRLADAERRAVRAERAKAEFMSHMGHELRTPLNAIIGFSEVIEKAMFGSTGHPKYLEYARDIGNAARELHARVEEILEFVHLDARRLQLAREPIDVSQIARECLLALQPQARARNVKILVALPAQMRACADGAATHRILTSIAANAVQYTPAGGEVRVAVRHDKDHILTTIRDSGLGFSEEEKVRAGEAFRRFERPGYATGLGLGLAIATTLARRMDGTLRISSTHGDGTTVELRLPGAAAV